MKKFKVKVGLSGSAYFSEDDQPVKAADVVQTMKKARAVDVDNFDKIKTAS